MFVAKHHVTLGGRQYMPGEVIEGKVPADTAEWWLSVGAVESVSPAYGLDPNVFFKHHPATPEPEPEPVDETSGQKDETDETNDQKDKTDETDDQKDEVDETAEPEEINVAAGIVRETETPAEPPAEPPAEAPVKEKRKRTPSKNGGKKS